MTKTKHHKKSLEDEFVEKKIRAPRKTKTVLKPKYKHKSHWLAEDDDDEEFDLFKFDDEEE